MILTLLATARLTRLVTADRLTERYRIAIIGKVKEGGLLAYLLVCDWCASVYIGALLAGAWAMWGSSLPYQAAVIALSGSYVAGFLNSKVDD
jgi:hypothetical protein